MQPCVWCYDMRPICCTVTSYSFLPPISGTLLDSYDQPFESRRLGFAVMGISGTYVFYSRVLSYHVSTEWQRYVISNSVRRCSSVITVIWACVIKFQYASLICTVPQHITLVMFYNTSLIIPPNITAHTVPPPQTLTPLLPPLPTHTPSGLSSEVPEVQRLVGQIAAKATDAWGDITSQELSMCLHGKYVRVRVTA